MTKTNEVLMEKYIFIICLISSGLSAIANDDLDSLRRHYHNVSSVEDKAVVAISIVDYFKAYNLDSAKNYGMSLLQHALASKYDSLIAIAYLKLGGIAFRKGKYEIAFEHCIEATKQYDKEKYPVITQALMHNLGAIFDKKLEYRKAREYYLKAEPYLNKFDDNEELKLKRQSRLYANIGHTYYMEANFTQALEYFIRAQTIAIENNDQLQIARTHSNIGSLYLEEDKYKLSEANYLEALKINEKLHNKERIAQIQMHLGELYCKMGNLEQALNSYVFSISFAEETKNLSTLLTSREGLHKLLVEKKDFEGAYFELLRNKQLNDSIFNEEKTAAIKRLENEYLFLAEKMKLEEEQHIKTLWNYSLGGGMLLLLVIFSLIYRNLKSNSKLISLRNTNLEFKIRHLSLEKSSLEEKLSFKNKELTTNVMYVLKKNELINTVCDKLLSMRGQFRKENQVSINRILLELQKASDKDVWQEFEIHFKNVHVDFWENLIKPHPNLSLNERKLCAFTKLNLTTNEICEITHQSASTLQVSRSRLRKKLGLESNDQLFNYLQKY